MLLLALSIVEKKLMKHDIFKHCLTCTFRHMSQYNSFLSKWRGLTGHRREHPLLSGSVQCTMYGTLLIIFLITFLAQYWLCSSVHRVYDKFGHILCLGRGGLVVEPWAPELGFQVRTPPSLCSVLEQDTLSSPKYW